MKKSKKALIIIGVVLAIVLAMALFGVLRLWGQKTPVDYEVHNENAASKKLAIITDNTIYKMGIKNLLVDKVGSDCCVEVFGLEDAKDVAASDYDLVVIMAPVYAGKLQSDAAGYINKNKSSDNLLLFMTAGLENVPDLGVDTIVGATSDFDTAKSPILSADDIVRQVLEKLG